MLSWCTSGKPRRPDNSTHTDRNTGFKNRSLPRATLDPGMIRGCGERGGEQIRLGPQGFLEPEALVLAVRGPGGPVGGSGAHAGAIRPRRASRRWDSGLGGSVACPAGRGADTRPAPHPEHHSWYFTPDCTHSGNRKGRKKNSLQTLKRLTRRKQCI